MPIVKFDHVGALGIIKDLPAHELPPEAWSDGKNIRFHDGKIEKFTGHSQIFNISASVTEEISIDPWWIMPVPSASNVFWIYASQTQVYAASSNTNNNNITRHSTATASDIPYNAVVNIRWNGGILGGIPFLNNGVDEPQVWLGVGLSTRLTALDYNSSAGTKWSDANLSARVLRSYKNYMVALDVTKTGTRFPDMVKWSHPADPGTTPSSWDETDPTKDAGEVQLADTRGYCIDCLPLRDTNIIYKDDTTWGMQFIGGPFVFRFFQMSKTVGALSRDCVIEFHNKHIVLSNADVVIHDGQTFESLLDRKWRKFLFNNIDTDYYENCYLVKNYLQNEVWICYPETGVSPAFFPNKALVWNYRENTFTVRDIPNISFATAGIVDFGSTTRTWANIGGTWGTNTTEWGKRAFGSTKDSLVMVRPDSSSAAAVSKFYLADDTDTFDNVAIRAFVERTGLTIAGRDNRGLPVVDNQNLKYLRTIWPKIEAINGTKITAYVGSQDFIGDSVAWSGPQTFTVGDVVKLDVRKTGRYFAVRFETSTTAAWKLTGYDLDIDLAGRW